MTVKEFIEYLSTLPKETKIYYADMNYGHPDEEFTEIDFAFDGKYLLIDSRYWEPVD